LKIDLVAIGKKLYAIELEVENATKIGFAKQVPVTFNIGNDGGSMTVRNIAQ
jgi:hypothetical protein